MTSSAAPPDHGNTGWGGASVQLKIAEAVAAAANGAARGQRLEQPQAHIPGRECGPQLGCSTSLGTKQWMLPNAACHTGLPTVGSSISPPL